MSTRHESELLARKVRSLIIDDDKKEDEFYNKGHPWSIVKLLLLGQWADIYSTIIKTYFTTYRFVDLLAGAGRTQIEETQGKLVKGSVFVVDTFAQKFPFDNYVLIERDTDKFNALKERTSLFGDRCEVLCEDTNSVVTQIFANYASHNLVFIDNEGFNVNWKSIEAILNAKADIIINYPTAQFERVAQKSPSKLTEFFGDESWRETTFAREYSVNIYMENLKNAYERIKNKNSPYPINAYVENIRLGNKSYFYDMILVTKQGDYTNVWGSWKKQWHGKNPDCMLSFVEGKSLCLDVFDSFSHGVSEVQKKYLKSKKQPKPNHNAKLESFFGSS